jgi:hypothetical protein
VTRTDVCRCVHIGSQNRREFGIRRWIGAFACLYLSKSTFSSESFPESIDERVSLRQVTISDNS